MQCDSINSYAHSGHTQPSMATLLEKGFCEWHPWAFRPYQTTNHLMVIIGSATLPASFCSIAIASSGHVECKPSVILG